MDRLDPDFSSYIGKYYWSGWDQRTLKFWWWWWYECVYTQEHMSFFGKKIQDFRFSSRLKSK